MYSHLNKTWSNRSKLFGLKHRKSGKACDDDDVEEPGGRRDEDRDVRRHPLHRRRRRKAEDAVEQEQGRHLKDQAANDRTQDSPRQDLEMWLNE